MANKQLVFENVARDLTGGQSFDLVLIDNGTSYSMYVRNTAQPPSTPGIAALITSVGGTPVIAPGGGGDVVGLGTTGTVPLWTDGPNSIIGNSVLTQVAGKLITPGDLECLNFEATNNIIAQDILTQTLEVQASVSGSLTLPTGGITLTLGNLVLSAGTITFPDNVRQTFNPGATTPGLNVGSNAGDPSTPANGDVWYDSTGNLLRARVNGATVSLGSFAIGGSNTQLQYNNAGALGGISGATTNGTSVTFGSGNLLATSPVFTTDITTPLILSGSTASGGTIRIDTTTNGTKGFIQIDGTTAGVGLVSSNIPAFFSNSVAVFGMRGVLNTSLRSDGYHGFSSAAGITDAPDATLSRNGAGIIQFGTTAANASGSWLATNGTLSGNLIMNGAASVIRLKGYTVATLPAGTQGDTAFVTDALAPTFLATVVGGGAVVTPVFFNGAAWVGY